MAEESKETQPGSDQRSTTRKRRLKPAETVRERSEKAAKSQPKQKKAGPKRWFSVLLKPLKIFRVFRFIIPPYFKNSWKELKQVTWPSRKETWKLTLAVFMFAIFFGAFITISDYGLDKIFKRILLR